MTGPEQPRLLRAARDTERYVAKGGWDQPVRLFALVRAASLPPHHPSPSARPGQGPDALVAFEQDELPPADDLQSLLGQLVWPADVDGVALAVERIVVPPEVERDLPGEPGEALEALSRHPARQDVRVLAAVLRSGPSVCLLRHRAHDEDDLVSAGPDLAPGLVHALRATLRD